MFARSQRGKHIFETDCPKAVQTEYKAVGPVSGPVLYMLPLPSGQLFPRCCCDGCQRTPFLTWGTHIHTHTHSLSYGGARTQQAECVSACNPVAYLVHSAGTRFGKRPPLAGKGASRHACAWTRKTRGEKTNEMPPSKRIGTTILDPGAGQRVRGKKATHTHTRSHTHHIAGSK